MAQNPTGHRGLSDAEAERVRALYWQWVDRELAAGRKENRRAFGKAIGVKGEAISQSMGQREAPGSLKSKPGSWKNRPSHATARAIAKLLELPSNCWADEADTVAVPAELDSVRMLRVARDLALAEDIVNTLAGDGDGARMKHLSEQKRKAVLGTVHLLGFPLEMVVDAAERVTEHDDDTPESLFTKISARLRGQVPKSGKYPSIIPPMRLGEPSEPKAAR